MNGQRDSSGDGGVIHAAGWDQRGWQIWHPGRLEECWCHAARRPQIEMMKEASMGAHAERCILTPSEQQLAVRLARAVLGAWGGTIDKSTFEALQVLAGEVVAGQKDRERVG